MRIGIYSTTFEQPTLAATLDAVAQHGIRDLQFNLSSAGVPSMPNMVDPYFSKTLTYICEHSEQGALGIVVNKPIDMTLQALFERLSLTLEGREQRILGFAHRVRARRGGGRREPQLPRGAAGVRRRRSARRAGGLGR